MCRRWKYLTSVEELWMLKTHEYGQFLIQCVLGFDKLNMDLYENISINLLIIYILYLRAWRELFKLTVKAKHDFTIKIAMQISSPLAQTYIICHRIN